MAEKPARRTRIEQNIFKRADGKYEIGWRDASGKQRWKRVHGGITAARRERDLLVGARANGEQISVNRRLKFGEAAERWLEDQVSELRPATREIYRNAVVNHLNPQWCRRRLDQLMVGDAVAMVRALRAKGLSEWTISGIVKAANRIFKYAARHLGFAGVSPFLLLEAGEKPRVSQTPERRIFSAEELEQTLDACHEPHKTLFRLASIIGARESELLGLLWADLGLADLSNASITFTHQLDRQGQRTPLKTEEAKATLPLPKSAALLLLAHRARSAHSGSRAFVFATATGRPLAQRNVLSALYRAQEKARTPEGLPTFPELFAHDHKGHLVVDEQGDYVRSGQRRRDLPPLPDFHALRHGSAMACDDAEEARDLLRHKNSTVTQTVYRAHFSDQRRQALRAKLEARHGVTESAPVEASVEATDANRAPQNAIPLRAEVLPLRADLTKAQ